LLAEKRRIELIDYILISVYAAAFVLGVVLINLNTITYLSKKTIENRIFLILGVLILIYLAVEYFVIYQINQNQMDGPVRILITVTNICYYLFIYYWLMLLAELSSYKFHKQLYIFLFAGYGIAMETIGNLSGEFQPETGTFYMEAGMAKIILIGTNLCFALWIIFLAGRYLITGIRHMEKGEKRNGVLTFGGLLVLYETWILAWDFNLVSGGNINPQESFFIDPMVVISIIYSISVIWIFYKKDPLGIYTVADAGSNALKVEEETTKKICGEFDLSDRETEVVDAILRGLNNPEVGKQLYISENTVKRHMNNIFRKTGTKSRYELLALFMRKPNP
jgi:DNA-binding CsgD family transcriptional regulator